MMTRPFSTWSTIAMLALAILLSGQAFSEVKTEFIGGLNPVALEIIDQKCQAVVDNGHTPGAVILIGRGDQVIMRKAYGNRMNAPQVEPMTLDTIFDLASLTKPICTAAGVMLLVQDEAIGLDEPVYQYVPEFDREDKRDITIRHLLTHTSGLPAYTSVAYLEQHYGPHPNPDGLIQRISELDKVYTTGEGSVYSCLNYLILARLVHNVSGKNMSEFLQERIWTPLGMKDTTFYVTPEQLPRTAPTIYTSQTMRRGQVHDPLAYYSFNEANAPGNAGGFSTIDDISRHVRLLLAGGELDGVRIFTPEICNLIMTDQSPATSNSKHTCGWGVWESESYSTPANRTPETQCLGHTGYTGTLAWMDKLSKTYVLFFSNMVYPTDVKENRDAVIRVRREIVRTVLDHLDIYQEGAEPVPMQTY